MPTDPPMTTVPQVPAEPKPVATAQTKLPAPIMMTSPPIVLTLPGETSQTPQNQDSRTPTTTYEQDLKTAGQRKINLIWEISQAVIALSIVGANIAYVFIPHQNTDGMLIQNAFFLVIGFYFGRTNHARMGDEAAQPTNRR